MIKRAKGISCTEDIFPIIHGNYFADISLPNVPSNFTYKHTQNPNSLDVQTYSNGDILVSYQFQIVVGAQNANNDNGLTSGIAKWIKQFILYINLFFNSFFKVKHFSFTNTNRNIMY